MRTQYYQDNQIAFYQYLNDIKRYNYSDWTPTWRNWINQWISAYRNSKIVEEKGTSLFFLAEIYASMPSEVWRCVVWEDLLKDTFGFCETQRVDTQIFFLQKGAADPFRDPYCQAKLAILEVEKTGEKLSPDSKLTGLIAKGNALALEYAIDYFTRSTWSAGAVFQGLTCFMDKGYHLKEETRLLLKSEVFESASLAVAKPFDQQKDAKSQGEYCYYFAKCIEADLIDAHKQIEFFTFFEDKHSSPKEKILLHCWIKGAQANHPLSKIKLEEYCMQHFKSRLDFQDFPHLMTLIKAGNELATIYLVYQVSKGDLQTLLYLKNWFETKDNEAIKQKVAQKMEAVFEYVSKRKHNNQISPPFDTLALEEKLLFEGFCYAIGFTPEGRDNLAASNRLEEASKQGSKVAYYLLYQWYKENGWGPPDCEDVGRALTNLDNFGAELKTDASKSFYYQALVEREAAELSLTSKQAHYLFELELIKLKNKNEQSDAVQRLKKMAEHKNYQEDRGLISLHLGLAAERGWFKDGRQSAQSLANICYENSFKDSRLTLQLRLFAYFRRKTKVRLAESESKAFSED